jgi:hypothetical protein
LQTAEEDEAENEGGPMPDAYMGVRIIEGPNTTDDESLTKRDDAPVVQDLSKYSCSSTQQ